jgi:drug/metabolite transporter (DMT)-like permease
MSRGTLLGVGLHLSALLLFVAMDTLVKLLTARYAVPQLMWARFLFGLLVVALALRLAAGRRGLPWRSRAPGLQALRSLLLAACNLMFSTALAHLPLTDATAIGFASPSSPWRWPPPGCARGWAGAGGSASASAWRGC